MKTQFVVKAVIAGCAIFASSLALAVPQVMAGDTIKLTVPAWGGANGGGEFTASALTGNSPNFQTFCLEYNEHFTPGNTLYVKAVNTGAKGGGGGAVLDPNTPSLTDTWDPVSSQTAYLYTKFSQGSLVNYDYGTSGSGLTEHTADSQSLQLAIWVLEDEISATLNSAVYAKYTALSAVGLEAQAFVAAANNAVSTNAWSGIGQVRALNLYSNASYTSSAQDQLYLQPIPEPETYAMMLAGLGLIGFVAGRRRRTLL
jgi:hypothetical protein